MLVGTHLAQRLETARTLIVILQIEHIHILTGKYPVGNGIVSSAIEPCRVVVASADMRSHEQVSRTAFKSEIIDLEQQILYLIEIRTKTRITLCSCLAYYRAPCAVVEL